MPAVPHDAPPRDDRYCLAIETSNPSINAEVALGLLSGGAEPGGNADAIAVEPLRHVARNEDDLLPAIDRACRRAGIAARQLARVGVSIGPGGYTSLRVACAAAKMIAEAVGARCVPVSSAAVAALGAALPHQRLGVCLASKDDAVYFTVFPPGWQGGFDAGAAPGGVLLAADQVPLDGLDALIGDEHLPAALRARAAALEVPVLRPTLGGRECLTLARLGATIDPVELLPFYPREPDAVTLWRKRLGERGCPS